MLGAKGEPRLARLRLLITRGRAAGGPHADDLRTAHAWRVDLARCLEPDATRAPERRDGATVRQEVEARLAALPARSPAGRVPTWLQEKARSVGVVLRRLGADRSHCDDVPGLPRTAHRQRPGAVLPAAQGR